MTNKEAEAVAELAVRLSTLDGATGMAIRFARTASALHALERKAHAWAERLCNQPVTEAEDERIRTRLLGAAKAALMGVGLGDAVRVEFNGDPRGAGLKLHAKGLPGNTWGGDSAGYAVGV